MVRTETIRHEFALRLIDALNKANYPPHGRGIMLAKRTGVTSKAVSKWLAGESLPRPATMRNIAKVLGVDPLWLQHGDEATKSGEKLIRTLFRNSFPLLEWGDLNNLESFLNSEFGRLRYFYSGSVISSEVAFWLIVQDDSMTSPVGPSIPERSMILVDTGRTPEHGQLVVAKLETAKQATFKQFYVDEGTNRNYLKPLNSNYKPIEINHNCTFIGVVVESRMNFIDPDPAEAHFQKQ